jgi:hypothetical protein
MEYVERYKDLEVYKAFRQLSKNIFSSTKNFPRGRKCMLNEDMRNIISAN